MDYQLNNNQLSRLLNDKCIYVNKYETIELYNNKFILNRLGNILNLENIVLTFPNNLYFEQPLQITMLQGLICEHFNLVPNEVIHSKTTSDDVVFKIRQHPDKEQSIVVCAEFIALENTKEMYETQDIRKYQGQSQIGIYKKLGNSFYYFRWLDELE